MSTKKWLKIFGVSCIIYLIYAVMYRQLHNDQPDLITEYYFGLAGHTLIFWYLIPRSIYRMIKKMFTKAPKVVEKPALSPEEELIERWINAGAA